MKQPTVLAAGAGYHLKRKRLVQSRFFLWGLSYVLVHEIISAIF
ncbi:hypothetical protein [Bacillus wiedmannii]|nr:hypothetical protein [Bacillus wiedmannii]